jgi:hypothetical protein
MLGTRLQARRAHAWAAAICKRWEQGIDDVRHVGRNVHRLGCHGYSISEQDREMERMYMGSLEELVNGTGPRVPFADGLRQHQWVLRRRRFLCWLF